ncbi:MAG: hypothetical protein ACRD1O_13955, partial [Terriglobia bacterium]
TAARANTSSDRRWHLTDGIILAYWQDNDKLHSLISQALSPIASPGVFAGGIMRAARSSGRRPCGILALPVSRLHPAPTLLRPAICVVVTDPDCQSSLPGHRLQIAFGFTEAEVQLTALLAAGEELRRVA